LLEIAEKLICDYSLWVFCASCSNFLGPLSLSLSLSLSLCYSFPPFAGCFVGLALDLEGELAAFERFICAPNNEWIPPIFLNPEPIASPSCALGDGQLKLLAGLTCRGYQHPAPNGTNPFCPLPIGLGYTHTNTQTPTNSIINQSICWDHCCLVFDFKRNPSILVPTFLFIFIFIYLL
jgi:hypothetical protein